jgi:hypothetical protein
MRIGAAPKLGFPTRSGNLFDTSLDEAQINLFFIQAGNTTGGIPDEVAGSFRLRQTV